MSHGDGITRARPPLLAVRTELTLPPAVGPETRGPSPEYESPPCAGTLMGKYQQNLKLLLECELDSAEQGAGYLPNGAISRDICVPVLYARRSPIQNRERERHSAVKGVR